MQIVIDISEEYYNLLKGFDDEKCSMDMLLLKNGTPLPKGHGRLIDEKDLSLMTVHMIDGMLVCDAPTIIEADKTNRDEASNLCNRCNNERCVMQSGICRNNCDFFIPEESEKICEP